MTRFIIERLARRFLSEGTNASAAACAILLQHAQQKKTVDLVLSGMLQALSGQKLDHVPPPLEDAVHGNRSPRIGQSASDRAGAQTELAGRLHGSDSIGCQPRDAHGRSGSR